MLNKNPSILGTRMVYREVDYAIYECFRELVQNKV